MTLYRFYLFRLGARESAMEMTECLHGYSLVSEYKRHLVDMPHRFLVNSVSVVLLFLLVLPYLPMSRF